MRDTKQTSTISQLKSMRKGLLSYGMPIEAYNTLLEIERIKYNTHNTRKLANTI